MGSARGAGKGEGRLKPAGRRTRMEPGGLAEADPLAAGPLTR